MSGDSNINKTFFKKYLCQAKIGKGSFGVVYSGINTMSKEKIAFKMETREEKKKGTLELETYRLICLQSEGIPKVYCYGKNQTHYILIQELLGHSLEELFVNCRKHFSLKTTCILGIEMLKRINFVHSNHYIHRDIKPENFMFGRNENEDTLYLIDFGLSKKYYSTTKKEHIKFCTGKNLTGTARYCGRNSHKGYEQSRRDDLESIGYVLMYFLLGSLPWQGLKLRPGEEHFERIAEKKESTSFRKLCQGQPYEFVQWFKYVDNLAFDETPDYPYLIGLFQEIINRDCFDCLYNFDWQKQVSHRLSVEIEYKSRNVSILVNNVNGRSTMNESQLQNGENGNNDDKEGKFNQNNIFGKDKENLENNDTDSPDFNASPILRERKLKKQEITNEEPIDQLNAITKKRTNSYIPIEQKEKEKVDHRKYSTPIFKQKSIRKASQTINAELDNNFGLLVKEMNEKKNKEEALKAYEPITISDNQIDNNKIMKENSITPSDIKNTPSSKCKLNIEDLDGKDLTKCNCILM